MVTTHIMRPFKFDIILAYSIFQKQYAVKQGRPKSVAQFYVCHGVTRDHNDHPDHHMLALLLDAFGILQYLRHFCSRNVCVPNGETAGCQHEHQVIMHWLGGGGGGGVVHMVARSQ